MSGEKNIPEDPSKDDSLNEAKVGEYSSDESIPAEQETQKPVEEEIQPELEAESEISNQKSETENMEVHHHGHVHEKNKWKEYLFQFFMLFLAVFCGFLAEYQLEQTIERHKEKDYIKSFTEDLQADLGELAEIIPSEKRYKLMLDSFNNGLQNSKVNTSDLYYYARQSTRPITFLPSDRTIIQLKNSGGFRLITNKQAADSIMAYQGSLDVYKYFLTRQYDEIQQLVPFLSKLFNASVFDTMVDSANKINRPIGNPPMHSGDPDLMNELSYYIHLRKSTSNAKILRLESIQNKAANTLEFLKKKYHLENE